MATPRNMEVFEAYFKRADLDQDGKISGNEAVHFFQGSNLPKSILAKVWMYADRSRTGFLGREEFYNALRLVTVAQSGRELTQDIVQAALFSPASSKIPPPQINTVSVSATQLSARPVPAPTVVSIVPSSVENFGARGPQLPNVTGMNQQAYSSLGSHLSRPPQNDSRPFSSSMQYSATGFASGSSNALTDLLGARPDGAAVGQPTSLISITSALGSPAISNGFSSASTVFRPSVASKEQDSIKDTKPVTSSMKLSSGAQFSAEISSANSSHLEQPDALSPKHVSSNLFVSPAVGSVANNSKPGGKQNMPDPFSAVMSPLSPSNIQQSPLHSGHNQLGGVQISSSANQASVVSGSVSAESGRNRTSWPSISSTDISKYTRVFMEVDVDRDGKITGPQARNLFMSWRLPREILKQVWDLSDQDNDSMLSLREFCIALYLMERHREGRTLPSVLPDSIKFDQMLPTGTPIMHAAAHNQPVQGSGLWRPSQVAAVQRQGTSAARPPLAPSSASKFSHSDASFVRPDVGPHVMQQNPNMPVLDKHIVNQLSSEEQSALNLKLQEAAEADKKVGELGKEILDSREKIEYYRSKMQEIVLYKSRCDNRLNEMTEKSLAQKREVETLGKKYEEKYKLVADLAAKVVVEEANFNDIQEKKMDLYQAIQNMEHGGTADGLLQVLADKIQSDLEQLSKALNERCKKYGLRVKPASILELPFGWQPGIQVGAADWDEDWDKFEDEGFVIVKELTVDIPNILAPPKLKSNLGWNETSANDETFTSSSISKENLDKPLGRGEHPDIDSSAHVPTEDGFSQSPSGSLSPRSILESSPRDPSKAHPGVDNTASSSPFRGESDHGGSDTTFSGNKYADEHLWGPTFDANDDADSVWGFGSKDNDLDVQRRNNFGLGDFGLNPIRTSLSPRNDDMMLKKSPFFADSVPGTPLFNSSPKFNKGFEESFDGFSRLDSFTGNDNNLFGHRESLTRYDSMQSTRDSVSFARFDSMRSTKDSITFTSFDDSDPFGSTGPFRSTDNQTPRHGSDHWSTF